MAHEIASEPVGGIFGKPEEVQLEKASPATKSDSSIDTEFEDKPAPRLHAKTILIVITCALLYFGQLAFIIACGAFGRNIGAVVGGADKTGWLVNVTTIAVVVLSVPVSVAADYWGRRWLMIVLTGIGFIGCIVLASAKSITVAIIGAVLGSIGGCTVALVHAIASEVLPRKYRMLGQGSLNAGAALGGLFALMIGGVLTKGHPAGFRTFFYILGGIYAAATAIVVVFYTPPPRPLQTSLTQREKIAKMDWIGTALLTIGFSLFATALSWAENPYPWTDAHILATLLVGAAVIVTLGVYEWKGRKDGLFHHGLYSRNRNFLLASLCIFAEGIVFYAAAGYYVYEMEVLYETNIILALFHFGLNFIIFGTVVPLVGLYCSRTKKIRVPMILAFTCFLTFNITMSTTQLGSGKAIWGYIVFLAFGMSMGLTTVMTAAQLSAPAELISHCSGLIISLRSLGGLVGLAIYGAIFNSNLKKVLGKGIAQAVLPLGLPVSSLPALIGDLSESNFEGLAKVPGITPEISAAAIRAFKQAFVDSFRLLWITAAAFTVVALVASFFTFDPIKDLNMHIDAPAEKEEDLYGLARPVHEQVV